MVRLVLVETATGAGAAVGRALRDAGHEVVHAGPATPTAPVVATLVQEDADLLVVAVTGTAPYDAEVGALREALAGQADDGGDVGVLVAADADGAVRATADWLAGGY